MHTNRRRWEYELSIVYCSRAIFFRRSELVNWDMALCGGDLDWSSCMIIEACYGSRPSFASQPATWHIEFGFSASQSPYTKDIEGLENAGWTGKGRTIVMLFVFAQSSGSPPIYHVQLGSWGRDHQSTCVRNAVLSRISKCIIKMAQLKSRPWVRTSSSSRCVMAPELSSRFHTPGPELSPHTHSLGNDRKNSITLEKRRADSQ